MRAASTCTEWLNAITLPTPLFSNAGATEPITGPSDRSDAATCLDQDQRHALANHQIAETRPRDQVCLRVRRLERKRADAGHRQIGAVAIEVDDMVGPTLALGRGQPLFEFGKRRRLADLELKLARAQGLKRIEHRRDAVARVVEALIGRATDDQQHAQRQVEQRLFAALGLAQLAPEAHALKRQRTLAVAQHLPGLAQHLRVVARERQQHRPLALDRLLSSLSTAPLAGYRKGHRTALSPTPGGSLRAFSRAPGRPPRQTGRKSPDTSGARPAGRRRAAARRSNGALSSGACQRAESLPSARVTTRRAS